MIAEAVQSELKRRNLTIAGFSDRYGFDRGTFTKFHNQGKVGSLEFVERWARTLGLDVNSWREMCGFPTVEPDLATAIDLVTAQLRERYETDPDEPIDGVVAFGGPSNITPQTIQEAILAMEGLKEIARRKQGREGIGDTSKD